MIRKLVFLVAVVAFIWFGATVNLGKRTLFGHIRAIWASDETQDLVDGVEEKGAPVIKRVERGVKAGLSDEPAPPPKTDK